MWWSSDPRRRGCRRRDSPRGCEQASVWLASTRWVIGLPPTAWHRLAWISCSPTISRPKPSCASACSSLRPSGPTPHIPSSPSPAVVAPREEPRSHLPLPGHSQGGRGAPWSTPISPRRVWPFASAYRRDPTSPTPSTRFTKPEPSQIICSTPQGRLRIVTGSHRSGEPPLRPEPVFDVIGALRVTTPVVADTGGWPNGAEIVKAATTAIVVVDASPTGIVRTAALLGEWAGPPTATRAQSGGTGACRRGSGCDPAMDRTRPRGSRWVPSRRDADKPAGRSTRCGVAEGTARVLP